MKNKTKTKKKTIVLKFPVVYNTKTKVLGFLDHEIWPYDMNQKYLNWKESSLYIKVRSDGEVFLDTNGVDLNFPIRCLSQILAVAGLSMIYDFTMAAEYEHTQAEIVAKLKKARKRGSLLPLYKAQDFIDGAIRTV